MIPAAARPEVRVVRKVATFGRILREGGVEVGPNRLQDALHALLAVDATAREDAYWALRCTMISRHEDIEVFDAAFAAFWDRVPMARVPRPAPGDDAGEQAREAGAGGAREFSAAPLAGAIDDEEEAGEAGMAWSGVERLRTLDFAAYTDDELRRMRRLVGRVARAAPLRRSRRLRAASDGRSLDKRRMLRQAIRTDGYPVVRLWRRRRLVPRRLVFVVDISGSMEPYARALIMFLQAAVRARRHVEAFTFGTRLTRVTMHLESHDPDRALRAAARAVPDWAGGTRIGDNIKALNDLWGRRGMTRGAVVVVVSDGWERGDVELLGREMERLRRAAHAVLWVNPLAGEPGYEPLAEGMAAALPHVDQLLAGHNLRSLEALAAVLESMPIPRGAAQGRR